MKKKLIAFASALLMLTGCGRASGGLSSEQPTAITTAGISEDTTASDEEVTTSAASETSAESTSAEEETTAEETTSATTASQTAEASTTAQTTATSAAKTSSTAAASTVTTTAASVVTTAVTTKPAVPHPHTAQEYLDSMTLHEKVCQMFITTPELFSSQGTYTGTDSSFAAKYDAYPVGGFIFFAYNIVSSDQTRNMTSGTQKAASARKGIGVFLATDEEGGSVTRVQLKLGTPAVYNMSKYGEMNDRTKAYEAGSTIGNYLRSYGFNVDFAPVADVKISPTNELGSRIFSSDPGIVANMAAAVVEGLHANSICSTLKHFPGLGAGTGNTHYGTVVIDRTLEQLRSAEFPAFKGGIDAGTEFVMVGHQTTTASGDSLPGDLSRVVVTDWLRGELGFEGLAVTDSHSMGAIQNVYPGGEAAVRSVEAGMDVILMPYSLSESVNAVEKAVADGRITEERINESVLRILKQKEKMGLLS